MKVDWSFKRLFKEPRAATAVEFGVLGGIIALVLGSLFIHLGGKLSFTLAMIGHSMTQLKPGN